ncbi:winged helix-turn-helix domain-containing protein [Burkholderia pseudomallei]|uniref:winged helix-turn-helix domain-containing protein n=1 Tax=Burkholderia pseudomallei TaxID=28450 RepID=UPI000A1A26B4|nr:winged helix-turn-helix domain-containing protein [Burkholderia pseudomallei]ARL91006.1 winged helix-turn-helix domain-containing protein [Burkholderia pseudomallei]
MPIDPKLKDWATPRQAEMIDAIEKHGSQRAAAKALGIGHGTIGNAMASLQARAAKMGWSPSHDMVHVVPDGFRVKGVSTYYDDEGKPRGQWVKSQVDPARQEEILREALAAMCETIPRVRPREAPAHGNADLLNCYVVTDFHLGALSWKDETGADWDLSIAENMIIRWFEQAIAQSPDAETAVFAQISDFLHADGIEALTPASKHLLDVDTRFAKVVRTAIRILRIVIDMLLAKHKRVHIIMADANHDPVSQIWLREWFAVLYENEPRITVDRSPSPYNAYEFGKVALFVHHGHKRKVTNVSEVFAAQFREMFGRTKYAYAHMGHLHSIDVKENNLMVVEQHRTLAAPDAYAARGGWLSGRDYKVITYHREYGEVSRVTINSNMLMRAA